MENEQLKRPYLAPESDSFRIVFEQNILSGQIDDGNDNNLGTLSVRKNAVYDYDDFDD